jgi:hypothetical protein
MRRRAPAGPVLTAAVGLALLLGGCGSHATHTRSSASASTPAVSGGRLSVAPESGHPTSTIRFTLVAPTPAGRHGQSDVSYALSVVGPQGSGCVAQHSAAVNAIHARQPVTVAVGPRQLGGSWCPGSYTARVSELARPVCGPGQVCPQFIRVMAVFGPIHFRIAS